MPKPILTDLDFVNTSRLTNLPNPVGNQEAATKAYVDSAVEGLAWKDSVRVSTQGNLNLASPGATIDGVTMTNGDRVLVRQQSTQSQNGIYIFNGAATPMTRALDANSTLDLEQAVVTVEEGADAGATFRQTQVNFTIDSGNIIFASFGTAAPAATETTAGIAEIATQAETDTGTDDARIVTPLKLATHANRKRKLTQSIGDGTATQFTITHNFNTREVLVEVYRNSGNFDSILCDVERLTLNSVRVTFSAAPTSNQYSVVVLG